jgi:hypothetical protein
MRGNGGMRDDVADQTRDRVCPVCARFIPEGAALTFMRRDNVIHVACLAAAQRRAAAGPPETQTPTPR